MNLLISISYTFFIMLIIVLFAALTFQMFVFIVNAIDVLTTLNVTQTQITLMKASGLLYLKMWLVWISIVLFSLLYFWAIESLFDKERS